MRQISEQNAVPGADDASPNATASELRAPVRGAAKSAKIHVVRARRQTLLHHKNRQNARIKRLLLIGVFALFYLIGVGVFYLHGLVDHMALIVATSLSVAVLVVFYACFALGWNNKTREKNLRVPITLCAIGIMLLMTYLAPATQILFTPFLFLTMAFVMHRVSPRTMLLLTMATLFGYMAVIASHYYQYDDWSMLKLEGALFLGLLLTLPGFVVLASRMQELHNALFKATRKIKDIEEDARRDALLGCFNRRYIVAALEQQKRMSDETGSPLCLAVIDLDHFKRVNDEAGHLGGDEVLRTFARIAEKNVRQHDVFGRYGGEEFLLVLPETSLLAALNIAERIREQVEQHDWNGKLRHRVTVSIGLTQHIPGESVLDLFSRTDTAMYMAKQGGRNQVVVEEPTADSAVA
ncbi:MAG: GGDEF domain-containing protein [Pseudomonadota bacterium]|uniref:GGDEF domain-containing protein n=1 Tax=Herminiimonas arsenitoxidans TaxID=1809410 RepID=UPI0009708314|nr:GGDEF domain-containing protein [Herminiimonas arsenitoxidans]